ncbi:MAG: pyruvate, phosphate dikinase [Deltaproteobacteria bacterium]|nr:pyruvate, phosphate dikinase [Deltaproteobacteria bacterium]
MTKYVYGFGGGSAEGHGKTKALLGGKGLGLAAMSQLGLPVPPGFTITTDVGRYYLGHESSYPPELSAQIDAALRQVEQIVGRRFGDASAPLLVSVRSGAAVSMPGMMDTILNLGLNGSTVAGLIHLTDNPRFGYDSYRRFIQMYGEVVCHVPADRFNKILDRAKAKRGSQLDTDLNAGDLQAIISDYLTAFRAHTGLDFPTDPMEQLWGAISAVFSSWNTPRAREYRRIHGLPDDAGTACNIQAMVYGNLGETSGTGVAFTRNPVTGERVLYGEYLSNAQGEDIVAGIRTPLPINDASRSDGAKDQQAAQTLEVRQPECYQQFVTMADTLERHFREMQDLEFTIESGRLWLLQARSGKRSAMATLRIATEMVAERMISQEEAVRRVEPPVLERLLHPTIDPQAVKGRAALATGLPASPGGAVGQIVLTADDAVEWHQRGRTVILVRQETSADDIHGMHVAQGLLTARGGLTSHAAVVARGMGKACVAGCTGVSIDEDHKCVVFPNGTRLKEGEWVSLDGSTGEVYAGQLPVTRPPVGEHLTALLGMADQFRRLEVRANAETRKDAETAIKFGAQGIGLARTEHMFFAPERIPIVREMIMAKDRAAREHALNKLLPFQRDDFKELLAVMAGRPITIRLLDPPLHEFLPTAPEECAELARHLKVTRAELRATIERLAEANPMLGHRGCRLGITYPEIYAMQVRALLEAAVAYDRASGVTSRLEIEIPLVAEAEELRRLRAVVDDVAAAVRQETGGTVDYLVGAMLELPRACLTADLLAPHADFFSFGTNDLTQTTFGISRDDAGRFLPTYQEQNVLASDPFVSIDPHGVGQLMRIAVERARSVKPQMPIGICGEHGGDPTSIALCQELGLDSVSCSPYRVPIARLAAAQAALKSGG